MTGPALALLDFSSIAVGIETADAMIKRAQLETIRAGTVQPGRYLVLLGGSVADVHEAMDAGLEVGAGALLDRVFLPNVHPEVVAAIGGGRAAAPNDALGVVETMTVAAAISAADAGVKGAEVNLVEIRLADGLGGKGIVLYSGMVADVEAAVEIAVGVLPRPELLVRQVVIPQLHDEMWGNLSDTTSFGDRIMEQL